MLFPWVLAAYAAPSPAAPGPAELEAAATAGGGVLVERGADRAVALRWSDAGADRIELVEARVAGGQVQTTRSDQVPEVVKVTERCGVGHHEATLALAAGAATFCVAAGGPPRLDGPIEVTTPAWRAVGAYRDGARVGPWRVTDPAGAPIAEGEYQRDRPTGTWTVRGAAVAVGEGTASTALGLRPLDVAPEAEPAVDVVGADLVQGQVAVRIRWAGAACEGLVYEILRPGEAAPVESWVVSGGVCPTAAERTERLGRVRAGLAAHGLDPVLPPPALIPAVTAPTPTGGPEVDLEGHHVGVIAPPPPDPATLDPVELIARLPWVGEAEVDATFEGVPVERRRVADVAGLVVPAVVAERGRWAVVYGSMVRDGATWRVAVGVGPVHTVAEGL